MSWLDWHFKWVKNFQTVESRVHMPLVDFHQSLESMYVAGEEMYKYVQLKSSHVFEPARPTPYMMTLWPMAFVYFIHAHVVNFRAWLAICSTSMIYWCKVRQILYHISFHFENFLLSPFFVTNIKLHHHSLNLAVRFSLNIIVSLWKVPIDTVKPVLRDHCHERPPVFKDQIFMAEKSFGLMQLTLSPKTTCLERPYFYGQWGWSYKTGSTVTGYFTLATIVKARKWHAAILP